MPAADPDAAIRTLSTAYPIALLPVRLETRFVTSGSPELKIRIYPDEIAADLHDPRLAPDELAAGKAYWTEAWHPASEPVAWQRLATRFPSTRAAWIAHVTTPTNVSDRPAGAPTFPTVAQRTTALASGHTNALPDAWVAIAYRGGREIVRATSSPVTQPLQLTFRPDVKETDPSLVTVDELAIEPELLWTIDFQHALDAGMALTLPLSADDLAHGFDRLVVVGVKTSLAPADAATLLANLFDAHHYSRGLALVQQGTPTNNTAGDASAYPPPDDPARAYAIERSAALASSGSDGARLALALGLPTSVFDHVDGAQRTEDVAAGAMSRALWPCTLGYFLEQLAAPLLTDAQIADVRQHFFDHVRGRGPYAAFRVGRVPYGLLPVVPIAQWAGDAGTIDSGLAARLVGWKAQFLTLLPGVSRVGKTDDPDADLLGVLGLDASTREIRVREVLGPEQVKNLLIFMGGRANADAAARTSMVGSVLAAAGIAGTSPRLAGLTYAPRAPRIALPFVTADPLSETAPLASNYIDELRGSPVAALRAAGQSSRPLLYHLIRQAKLLELVRIAVEVAGAAGGMTTMARVEPELVNIETATEAIATPWQRLTDSLPAITGTLSVGEWLLQPSTDGERTPVRDYQAALATLAPLPTAELERLLTETLDTCSHRLDAWLTSLATRKLAKMRVAAPSGVHLGAFGWALDLRPSAGPRDTSGGHIHAPTATHAAAAAILRNAYMTRTGAEREQVALDLSSRRVRTGLELIDGVRQGQPLGALLGYRFEAALHAAQLDVYIAPLRAAFPLGTHPATQLDPASERIPARDVVDGLALRDALAGQHTEATIPWAQLPTVAGSHRAAMTACLAQLDDTIDATADLMLAESIYQAVQGNVDRASSTLGALAGGATLSDPEIAQSPRRVTSYTQRVAVVLGNPGTLAAGWNASAPRALAEPRLDAWFAERFGDPSRVQCRIRTGHTTKTIAIADLGLCALDVVALARVVDVSGGGELAARIAWHATNALGITGPVEIDHGRAGDADVVTMLELLDVARLLDAVVARARPLSAADLDPRGAKPTTGDDHELATPASHALTALNTARTALAHATNAARAAGAPPAALTALREASWAAAAFGVGEAVPATSDPSLLAQLDPALAALDRRIATATKATAATARLAAIFGPQFTALPTFAPLARPELDAARAYGATLAGDPYAARGWFERVARVREPLGNLRLAAIACEAIGGGTIDLAPRQLPHVAGAHWIALPIAPGHQPRAGTLSLALHEALDMAAATTLSGFVVDDWTEAIPSATQSTSFAVHYDAPGAEAAQCVLLAVPPSAAPSWDLATLIATVEEALDVAMLRAIDSDLLGPFAMLLPTTYLAANVAGDTISTHLGAYLKNEATVLAAE